MGSFRWAHAVVCATFSAALLTAATADAGSTPDLLSFGVGAYDVDLDGGSDDKQKQAADFRAEYRFGFSLLPLTEPVATLHPWLGLEATSRGALFGGGGILLDIPLGPVVVTPSFGVGAWGRGTGKELGSAIEFRSMIEIGYRFENEMRLTAYVSHTSNAGIDDDNPGLNAVGAYLHIPVTSLFGGS